MESPGQRAAQSARNAVRERPKSPEVVQRGKAVRHPAGVQFAEVTATLTHDAIDEYTVQKIDESGTKDGTDIIIDRALGYEGYGTDGTDIRNYSPWFGVGAIVPISQHYDDTAGELKWFIDMPFVFIGKPVDRSIDIDETYQRTMAVWK